jgi:hypothetical protein
MIDEIVNDYVEYLKVDLTKEVMFVTWFTHFFIMHYSVLVIILQL